MTEGVFPELYFAGNSLSASEERAAEGGGPYGGTPSVTASGGDSSLKEGALESKQEISPGREISCLFL